MRQVVLPLAALACPDCHQTTGWLRIGDACECGYTSTEHRRKLHIREHYANKSRVPTIGALHGGSES